MTTPIDQADLSLALVARALEKAQGALGVPALDKLHELFQATFAALATALTAAEADVKVLRGMNRGRQPMHPGLAASIEAVTGEKEPDGDECPNCHNGTLEDQGDKLACRGECGAFFDKAKVSP